MRDKLLKQFFGLAAVLFTFVSCAEASDYVSEMFKPIQYDGTMIYSGIGHTNILYLSTESNTYGALCTDPLCFHTVDEPCLSQPMMVPTAMALDGEGNLLAAGACPDDFSLWQIKSINFKEGTQKEILSGYPSSIYAMIVAGEDVWFLSPLATEDSTEENHSVCKIPLTGGNVRIIDLPEGDYAFVDSDSENIYVRNNLERTLTAIDRETGQSHILYHYDNKQYMSGFIDGNFLYTYVEGENTEWELALSPELPADTETIRRNYTTYHFAKIDLTTGEVLAKTEERYCPSAIWGYMGDGKICLPAFSPTLCQVTEERDSTLRHATYYGTAVHEIDPETMTVREIIEIGQGVRCIAYADENKIIFSGTYQSTTIMGYAVRDTGEIIYESMEWIP